MRFSKKTKGDRYKEVHSQSWHMWFAWYPVTDQYGVTWWLEFVWRKLPSNYTTDLTLEVQYIYRPYGF